MNRSKAGFDTISGVYYSHNNNVASTLGGMGSNIDAPRPESSRILGPRRADYGSGRMNALSMDLESGMIVKAWLIASAKRPKD